MLRINNLNGFGRINDSGLQILSADNVTVIDNQTFTFTITTSVSTTLAIGGADAAEVELVSNSLGKTHVLRWASNGVKHITTPDDADSNNLYEITITATDAHSHSTPPQAFTIKVDYNWIDTVAFDFGLDSTNYNGYNFRQTLNSLIMQQSGSMVRLRLQAGAGGIVNVGSMYIGEQASSGDVYDMKTSPAPAQILVNGSGSFSVPAGTMLDTDPLAFAIDEAKSYVTSAWFSAGAVLAYRTGFPSSVDVNLKASSDEAATADVSGYTPLTAGTVMLVNRIQVTTPT